MNTGAANTSGGARDGEGTEVPNIPDHTLLRCIGRGSYGEVWLARTVLGEHRAVKIVYRSRFEHDRPYEREFEGIRKFEPISRSHESQVDILHVGRDDDGGCFYYVMELADDGGGESEQVGKGEREGGLISPTPSLTFSPATYQPHTLKLDLHRRSRLPVTECIDIGLSLCRALQHLHGHGLVHRDIKPSNIIFIDGIPKLADIGLVASMDATMSFVGTSGFVPPEGPGTPQGDIYSLGKVLYEISMGRDRTEFPKLPADLADGPDAQRLLELNAVILKACNRDPQQRYQSCAAMRAELELLQRGKSVRGKRVAERWRVRIIRTAIVTSMITLFGGIVWFASTRIPHTKTGLVKSFSPKPAAIEAFRLGTAAAADTRTGFADALAHFHRAIELDAGYVAPYVELAHCYWLASDWYLPPRQAMPEARRNALFALQLDDSCAQAHVWLGYVEMLYDHNWARAEQQFRRAIALDPKNVQARAAYAQLLRCVGQLTKAHEEQELAAQLNAEDAFVFGGCVVQLCLERKYDEAIERARKRVARHPASLGSSFALAWAYERAGQFPEFFTEIEKTQSLGDSSDLQTMLGHAYAVTGQSEKAHRVLKQLEESSQRVGYVSPVFRAMIHAGLDEKKKALQLLKEAAAENSPLLIGHNISLGLKIDPYWDGLRSETEFTTLLREIGLEK